MPILALTRDGYKWPQVLIQVQLIHSLPFVTNDEEKNNIRYPFFNTGCPQGIPRNKPKGGEGRGQAKARPFELS